MLGIGEGGFSKGKWEGEKGNWRRVLRSKGEEVRMDGSWQS